MLRCICGRMEGVESGAFRAIQKKKSPRGFESNKHSNILVSASSQRFVTKLFTAMAKNNLKLFFCYHGCWEMIHSRKATPEKRGRLHVLTELFLLLTQTPETKLMCATSQEDGCRIYSISQMWKKVAAETSPPYWGKRHVELPGKNYGGCLKKTLSLIKKWEKLKYNNIILHIGTQLCNCLDIALLAMN